MQDRGLRIKGKSTGDLDEYSIVTCRDVFWPVWLVEVLGWGYVPMGGDGLYSEGSDCIFTAL